MQNDKTTTVLRYIKRMNCLTVLRDITEQNVFKALNSMLTAMLNDESMLAEKNYHRLTQQLIIADAKRVSGHMLKDYIIEWIVTDESEFAIQAAKGRADAILSSAMSADVRALLDIASLSTGEISRIIDSASGGTNDRISALSSALWAGRDVDNTGRGGMSPTQNYSLTTWSYDADDGDIYACNPALTNIYEAMIAGDTTELVDELWNFFNTCGTGTFIRNKFFTSDSNELLRPINDYVQERELLPFMYADEYNKMLDTLTAFANGEVAENTVLCGARGSGKSTMLASIAEVEKRISCIYVSAYSMPNIVELFNVLRREPIRFAVIIDDAQECVDLSRLISPFYRPSNVMILAATTLEEQTDYFDLVLSLPSPDPTALTKYICDISFSEASADAVRNVCMDYQIETKRPLSYNAVKSILRRL